jgi:hypothetical protein
MCWISDDLSMLRIWTRRTRHCQGLIPEQSESARLAPSGMDGGWTGNSNPIMDSSSLAITVDSSVSVLPIWLLP